MRPNRFFVCAIFWFCLPLGAQSVNVPLDHWAYDFLERMEIRHVLTHFRDGVRPMSRKRMAEHIAQVVEHLGCNPGLLSKTERRLFERLKGEFIDECRDLGLERDEREKEPHFAVFRGEPGFGYIDALGGFSGFWRNQGSPTSERTVVSPYFGGILRAQVWNIGLYSDTRVFAEWGTRTYIQHYKPSEGYPQNTEKDSSSTTWDESDSYLVWGWRGFQFQFGREKVQWGPSRLGGLTLSGLTPSYDMAKITLDWGRFTATAIHASLRSDIRQKWLAAHRLEVSLGKGADIGFSETVIYGRRGLEPAYVNPLIPYLVVQHSLGDRDNLVWGLDLDVHALKNVRLAGELLIDDLFAVWELFDDYWGNKLAFALGATWVDPFFIKDSQLGVEYTRIEPFVYTHNDTVNVYEHFDAGLGHFLEPNSDMLFLESEHRFSLRVAVRVTAEFRRHGKGSRSTPHIDSDGSRKRFLDGVVEKRQRFGIDVDWELRRDVRIALGFGRVSVANDNLAEGVDRIWNEASVQIGINW